MYFQPLELSLRNFRVEESRIYQREGGGSYISCCHFTAVFQARSACEAQQGLSGRRRGLGEGLTMLSRYKLT